MNELEIVICLKLKNNIFHPLEDPSLYCDIRSFLPSTKLENFELSIKKLNVDYIYIDFAIKLFPYIKSSTFPRSKKVENYVCIEWSTKVGIFKLKRNILFAFKISFALILNLSYYRHEFRIDWGRKVSLNNKNYTRFYRDHGLVQTINQRFSKYANIRMINPVQSDLFPYH